MDLENATLRHHWRFNGNLADSVGTADFIYSNNELPTRYKANKDGILDTALDNSLGNKTHWSEIVTGIGSKYTMSAWCQRPVEPNFTFAQTLSFGIELEAGFSLLERYITVQYKPLAGLIVSYPSTVAKGDWFHLVVVYDSTIQEVNVYINKDKVFTRNNSDSSVEMRPIEDSGYCLNCGVLGNTIRQYGNIANVDEIKIYEGCLTEEEIVELYFTGVNNIKAPKDLILNVVEDDTVQLFWKRGG